MSSTMRQNQYGRLINNRYRESNSQRKAREEKEKQKKETDSLREDYKKSYIQTSSSNVNIFLAPITKKMKKKSNINKNIDEIENYIKKKGNKCKKITKGWFSKKRNTSAEYNCRDKYDKLIKIENNKAINKLYTYSKQKLMKYILRLNDTSKIKNTVNLINKYTKILEEIYGRCKNTNTSNNKFNYQNLLKTINEDNDLKKFYELNNAYINFLYKDRDTQDGEVFNTLNKLTKINEKLKNIIDNIEKTDTICSV